MNRRDLDGFLDNMDQRKERSRSNSSRTSNKSLRPILKKNTRDEVITPQVQNEEVNPLDESHYFYSAIPEQAEESKMTETSYDTHEIEKQLSDLRLSNRQPVQTQNKPIPDESMDKMDEDSQDNFGQNSESKLNQSRNNEANEILRVENEKLRREVMDNNTHLKSLQIQLEAATTRSNKSLEKEKKLRDIWREMKYSNQILEQNKKALEEENKILKERLVTLEIEIGKNEIKTRDRETEYKETADSLDSMQNEHKSIIEQFGSRLKTLDKQGDGFSIMVNNLVMIVNEKFHNYLKECTTVEEYTKTKLREVTNALSKISQLLEGQQFLHYLKTVCTSSAETDKIMRLNEYAMTRYLEVSQLNTKLDQEVKDKKLIISEFVNKVRNLNVWVAAFYIFIGVALTLLIAQQTNNIFKKN